MLDLKMNIHFIHKEEKMDLLWDIRVVLDLFLGGIGIGAFILASILYMIDAEKYKLICKTGFIIAPIFVAVGLVFLLLEIGRPFQAATMMFFVNPTSVMSWGGFLQAIFMVLSVYVLYKVYKNQEQSRAVLMFAMFFALAVGIYHGALLTSIGQAAWNGALLTLFLTTSLVSGTLLTLFLSNRLQKTTWHNSFISLVLVTLVFLSMVSLLGWLLAMGTQSVESKEALTYLCSHFTVWIWIAFIFAMAIPMVVYVKSLITQKELSSFEFYITSLGAVVGVFVLKYVVVYLGQLDYLVK